MTPALIRQAITQTNNTLYRRGYNTYRGGVISVRSDGRIYITLSDALGNPHLTKESVYSWPEEENPVDSPSNRNTAKVASRHHRIYKTLGDVGAVIQTQPPHVLALVTEPSFLESLSDFPEYQAGLDNLPLLSTKTKVDALAIDLFKDQHTLIDRYGVTVLGKDLEQAFERLERLEHYAKILVLSPRPRS